MKPSSSAAGTGSDNADGRGLPGTECPGAIAIAQQGQLLLEKSTTAVFAPIMVAKNDGHWTGQLGDPLNKTQIAIAEIADEQQGISAKLLCQHGIPVTPVTVQISDNGKTERRQSNCLG